MFPRVFSVGRQGIRLMKLLKTKCCSGLIVLSLALAVGPAHALRCGHKLIARGAPAVELLRYCGEPLAIESHYAQRAYAGRSGTLFLPGFLEEVVVEEWTYNFGPRRFMRLVRLENGVVTEIRQLGYGFLPPLP